MPKLTDTVVPLILAGCCYMGQLTYRPSILVSIRDVWMKPNQPFRPVWEAFGVRDSQYVKQGFVCDSVVRFGVFPLIMGILMGILGRNLCLGLSQFWEEKKGFLCFPYRVAGMRGTTGHWVKVLLLLNNWSHLKGGEALVFSFDYGRQLTTYLVPGSIPTVSIY